MINNFDMSSKGVNLVLVCEYDNDLARLWFKEAIEEISTHTHNSIFVYKGADVEVLDPEELEAYTYTKNSLIEFLRHAVWTDEQLVEILDCLPEHADLEALKDCYESAKRYGNYAPELREFLTPKYDLLDIIGYCSGQRNTVYLLHDYWEKVGTDKTPEALESMRQYVEKLFYDQPLYCRIEIDGVEWDLMQDLDLYDYDKEKILNSAKKLLTHEKKIYILEWLEGNLPEYPHAV